ncbi:PKD2 [Symbiodinium sp. CCMP2592]|nr:PKD2 [Symbiodinium sp. CCMP2592]
MFFLVPERSGRTEIPISLQVLPWKHEKLKLLHAQSPDAAPLMESVGGVEGLRKMLNLYTEDQSEANSRCVTCRDVYLQVGQCCASLCSRQG